MSNELFVTVLVALAIVVGIVGTLAPVVPGLALVWVAMLLYGVTLGFGWIGAIAMLVATLLVGLGMYLGVRIPQRTASRSGVSIRGQFLGLLLAVVGFFAIPVVGAPVGFVFGVWLVRRQDTGDSGEAWRSTKAAIGSMVRASAAQALCGLGMAAAWAVWVASNVLSVATGG